MAEQKKIKDYIDVLKLIKHHIEPKTLEVGEEYHVPPFFSIQRMDVVITSKKDSTIKFKILNSSDKSEKEMDESSVLSRFFVKKMKY